MSRTDITYAEVVAAAEMLMADGKMPGAKQVFQQLSRKACLGSVQKHMISWREAKENSEQVAAIELSPELKAAWIKEVEGQLLSARRDISDKVTFFESELSDLSVELEERSIHEEELASQNQILEEQLSQLKELLAEKENDNDRLRDELEQQGQANENYRVELAREQLKMDNLKELLERSKEDLRDAESQITAADSARNDMSRKLNESEKHLAVEEGRVQSLNEQNNFKAERVKRLEEEKEELKQQLKTMTNELKDAMQAQKSAEIQSAASDARVKHLTEVQDELIQTKNELRDLKKDNQKLRDTLTARFS